jgi:hypothetical protein
LPSFFIPGAKDAAMAEQVYATFASHLNRPVLYPTARVCAVTFVDRARSCTAEVDKDIRGWRRETVGIVIAIFMTPGLTHLFTVRRGLHSSTPILIGSHEVLTWSCFDDFAE